MLLWHVPALYDATLRVEPLHIVEHVTFIAAGALFWWPIIDPLRPAPRRTAAPLEKIAMLVVAGLPPTILGLLFAVARHPLYSFYLAGPRLWRISPLTDQQLAGTIMFGAGNLIYFVAISAIFLRMFRDPAADEHASPMRAEPSPGR
jgi:cytochrome c oxidase assembly factor CtaG